MRYYNFFDADGTSITIREVSRTRYGIYDELRAIVVYCVPINKCEKLLGKEVKVLVTDIEDFVFNKIEIPRPFFRRDEVFVVSGTLIPHQGNLIFVYGLPYAEFISRLSAEAKETYYRDLYLKSRLQLLEAIKSLKEDLEKDIATLSSVTSQCKEIIKKYNDYIIKTFGFLAKGPEGLQAVEAALTLMEQALAQQQVAGPAPAAAPPSLGARIRSVLARIGSALRRVLARLGGRR